MADQEAPLQPKRAIRFVFEYEGEQLRVVAQQDVEMVVADTPSTEGPGYYLDARDSQERTLARVPAPGAFMRSAEVFPERHDEPITRIDVAKSKGAFTVTVPAADAADHVTVVRVARVTDRSSGLERVEPRAVDLASFPLSRR
jgi:hypothetical protein